MTRPELLERIKLSELSEELQAQGYQVTEGQAGFDLVATRGEERLAYEVKVRPVPHRVVEQVQALRRKAREEGYSDFRLVVMAPPQPVTVEIEGLAKQLRERIRPPRKPALAGLASVVRVVDVSDLDFDRVRVVRSGLVAKGTGLLSVELENDAESPLRATVLALPFDFSVRLGGELQIEQLSYQVDVEDWYRSDATSHAAD